MDKLLNAITENEYEMFGYRCRHFGDDDCDWGRFTTPRTILSKGWAEAKGDLFDLFGEKLILSKPVEYVADIGSLTREFETRIESGGPISTFYNKSIYKFYNQMCDANNGSSELYYAINQNFSAHSLATNEVDEWCRLASGFLPDGTKIAFTKGAKIMRIYAKIAHAFGLDAEFEAARLEHSQVLNQKKLSGELCLSIHPLDYSTMSDNDNNWGSCMSWEEYGEFRQGTVEMMNSPNVVVAYLKSDREELVNGRYSWNSKKWRELFVINLDLITGIKGYPYQSTALENIVIEWLRELAKKNWECEYADPYEWRNGSATNAGCALRFETREMYSDFGSRNTEHTHLLAEGQDLPTDGIHYVMYSGYSQCMCCGSMDNGFDNEGNLNCNCCNGASWYCEDCGCKIRYEDDVHYIDGVPYCEDCYGYHLEEDIFTDYEVDTRNRQFITIVPDDATKDEIYKLWVNCGNCYSFPIYSGYTKDSVRGYFSRPAVQQCIEGYPNRYEFSSWNYGDVISLSQLKDEFFNLEWVFENIGTREDLIETLDHMLERVKSPKVSNILF